MSFTEKIKILKKRHRANKKLFTAYDKGNYPLYFLDDFTGL
jgi:hypothetical protein